MIEMTVYNRESQDIVARISTEHVPRVGELLDIPAPAPSWRHVPSWRVDAVVHRCAARGSVSYRDMATRHGSLSDNVVVEIIVLVAPSPGPWQTEENDD